MLQCNPFQTALHLLSFMTTDSCINRVICLLLPLLSLFWHLSFSRFAFFTVPYYRSAPCNRLPWQFPAQGGKLRSVKCEKMISAKQLSAKTSIILCTNLHKNFRMLIKTAGLMAGGMSREK